MKWLEERSINELNPTGDIKKSDQVFPYSIYDIEDRIQAIENHRNSLVNTNGMHTLECVLCGAKIMQRIECSLIFSMSNFRT